jgi:hypothetical protein
MLRAHTSVVVVRVRTKNVAWKACHPVLSVMMPRLSALTPVQASSTHTNGSSSQPRRQKRRKYRYWNLRDHFSWQLEGVSG